MMALNIYFGELMHNKHVRNIGAVGTVDVTEGFMLNFTPHELFILNIHTHIYVRITDENNYTIAY